MARTPARGPDPIVVLEGARRTFGETVALEGLDLALRRGEMFGLIGPDGAGKSTTLKLVTGLLPPTAGRATTLGLEPRRDRKALSRRIGYISQRFSLYGDLTVDENLEFFARIQGITGWRERRERLLEWARLGPFRKRLGDRLSGGMKQKLALACTLMHTPELLVLDEPTTGVDPVSRRDFWRLLTELRSEGLTILMSTPYLDEAERCTRIAFLSAGRLLGVDEPDAMRRTLGEGWHELLAAPRQVAEALLASLPGVHDVEAFGERLHFRLDAGIDRDRLAASLVAGGVTVTALRPVRASLEDVFLARLRAAAEAT